jgi:hypothetical protein
MKNFSVALEQIRRRMNFNDNKNNKIKEKKIMFQKLISIALLIAIVNLSGMTKIFAASTKEKDAQKAAQVKASIQKLGTGETARVKIKLKDNSKLSGYVSDIKEEYFIVKNPQTGQFSEIGFGQVKKVSGSNFSTGAKIAIGIGIAAAAVIAVVVLANGKVCKNSLCQ